MNAYNLALKLISYFWQGSRNAVVVEQPEKNDLDRALEEVVAETEKFENDKRRKKSLSVMKYLDFSGEVHKTQMKAGPAQRTYDALRQRNVGIAYAQKEPLPCSIGNKQYSIDELAENLEIINGCCGALSVIQAEIKKKIDAKLND
jgi:hypothetical protein